MIPTARAMREYQDCGVSKTPGGMSLLLLGYSCLKCHENGIWGCEAENGKVFRSQRNGTDCLMRGLSVDSPRLYLGLFKIVQN